jgi:hypothetical protein
MARPRPEKKRERVQPATGRLLPMELQFGDRLTDETGEWEIHRPAVHDERRQERSHPRQEGRSARRHGDPDLGRARADRGEARMIRYLEGLGK